MSPETNHSVIPRPSQGFSRQLTIPKILFSFTYLPRQLWGSAFSQHFSVTKQQTRQQILLFYFVRMFIIVSTVAVKWEETLKNTEELGEEHLLGSYTWDSKYLCRNNAVWVREKKIKLAICWMEMSMLNYQWVEILLSWELQSLAGLLCSEKTENYSGGLQNI